MWIKVCANQETGPLCGPEGGYNWDNFGYLKKYSCPTPLAQIHWYFVWSNLSPGLGDL